MKDTVTDMRAHVWRAQVPSSILEKTEGSQDGQPTEEFGAVKEAILKEIDAISNRIGVTETQISTLRSEIAPTVDRALTNSKLSGAWEAETINLRRSIINIVRNGPLAFRRLRLSHYFNKISITALVGQLIFLRVRGLITWDGPLQEISDDAVIDYTGPQVLTQDDLVGDTTFQVTSVNRTE
ncbi:hypothetical protein [Micromonospora sp. NPDC004704]